MLQNSTSKCHDHDRLNETWLLQMRTNRAAASSSSSSSFSEACNKRAEFVVLDRCTISNKQQATSNEQQWLCLAVPASKTNGEPIGLFGPPKQLHGHCHCHYHCKVRAQRLCAAFSVCVCPLSFSREPFVCIRAVRLVILPMINVMTIAIAITQWQLHGSKPSHLNERRIDDDESQIFHVKVDGANKPI